MKKLLLLTLFIRFTSPAFSQEAIDVKPGPVRMQVHNICYNAGVVVICNGSDSLGIHPSIGYIYGMGNIYQHIDSLLLMDRIIYFSLDDYLTTRIVLGDSNRLVSCLIDSPNAMDTLSMDSISGASISNNNISVITNDSLFVFDTLSNNYLYAYSLNFSPRFVSASANYVSVAGVDVIGQTRLMLIDYQTSNVELDTTLGIVLNNPVGLQSDYYGLGLVSAPGDTAMYNFSYNRINHTASYGHCYTGSGPHCLSMYSGFYFQPESDPSMNGYEFSLYSGCGPNNINRRIKSVSLPVANSYYPYVSIVPDSPNVDRFVRLDAGSLSVIDSIQTDLNPVFIVNDYRCPIKVAEYDDSYVEWKIYPNPSVENTILVASGLICGRDYKLDITDMNGRILYETTVHSKTSYTLPVDKYPKGIYFVRIHSLKGLVVQKLVKL